MSSQDQYAGLVSPQLHADDADVCQRRTSFPIRTDPLQDDKATEIKLLSVARPHMRAFHYAWLSFFFAFFGWFSIPPLMPTIKKQLGLTADQVSNSNIVSVASRRSNPRGFSFTRNELHGTHVCSILHRSGRLFLHCDDVLDIDHVWTSTMFSKEVVGSANALAAGWGNLGAGATTLITPQLFNLVTTGGALSDNMGWRVALLFPAFFMVITGIALYFNSDDCPQGQYKDLRRNYAIDATARKPAVDMKQGLLRVAKLPVTWILAFQYACSFGVELQVHNVLTEYYYEDFTYSNCDPATDVNECRRLTQSRATLISSLFGLMCIFARALGGYISDVGNRRCGMKGRIGVQFVSFAGQAVFLYLYSTTTNLASSISLLIFFGIFVQACTGSTYGIVPYVLPAFTGATSGFVGAGGNVGALCWSLMFKGIGKRGMSFKYLSIFVAVAALATLGIKVPGNAALWEKVDSAHDGLAPTEVDDESVHNGKQTVI
ncbi:Sporangia induced Major Facilitator Superfamily (MFS) [Phytophthora palmivora]|uniref:Sporangia induced Major Facilitator Superfamily (MFS) n=1 Tax=Phytophthora palmivora TaxID=4796 RepID=A0A2P4YE87_9STRA|nr:Sporangia induced Major Facilitator Superfamily (MFS) [Phytophthora palmivora]